MYSLRAVLVLAISALHAVVPAAQASFNCIRYRHNRYVHVNGTAALTKAVEAARPGTLIYLKPGRYSWLEVTNKRGRIGAPITICGSRQAVFDGSANKRKIMIKVYYSTYINLAGFSIQNALKGIQTHNTTRSTFNSVRIYNVGQEAIHVARWSSYNLITRCRITHTERESPGTGEGVYIGSDDDLLKNDNCNGNRITYNIIGPHVTGDPIDIKQNSSNGLIEGNRLDGKHLCGCNYAVSLINVKGNNWDIIGNVGRNSIEDMFKTATTIPGQARGNYFAGNKCMGMLHGYYCVKVSDFGGGDKSPNKVGCGQMGANNSCSSKESNTAGAPPQSASVG